MSIEIGFRDVPDLHFQAEMWRDDLNTLQQMMSAKETREGTDFVTLPISDGGVITVDLNEVLYVNAQPYLEDENTTIEVEYIDDGYGDE